VDFYAPRLTRAFTHRGERAAVRLVSRIRRFYGMLRQLREADSFASEEAAPKKITIERFGEHRIDSWKFWRLSDKSNRR